MTDDAPTLGLPPIGPLPPLWMQNLLALESWEWAHASSNCHCPPEPFTHQPHWYAHRKSARKYGRRLSFHFHKGVTLEFMLSMIRDAP